MITPGGHPLEGVAIQPHHIVPQTVTDFLEGRDTQVEYILKTAGYESSIKDSNSSMRK